MGVEVDQTEESGPTASLSFCCATLTATVPINTSVTVARLIKPFVMSLERIDRV